MPDISFFEDCWLLREGNTDWMAYHAYDANQIGIPKLRIESLSWDVDGWPSLPSQAQAPPAK